jgi:hypothetical protein
MKKDKRYYEEGEKPSPMKTFREELKKKEQ